MREFCSPSRKAGRRNVRRASIASVVLATVIWPALIAGQIQTENALAPAIGTSSAGQSYIVQVRAFVGTGTLEGCVTIKLNATIVIAWNNTSLPSGTYPVSTPSSGPPGSCLSSLVFSSWSASANLSVASTDSNSTTLTVRGSGVLVADYSSRPPHLTPCLALSCQPYFWQAVIILAVIAASIVILILVIRKSKGSGR